MPKTIYKEEQRFRNPGLLALFALMTLLLCYRIGIELINGATTFDVVVTALIAIAIGFCWYGVYQTRLKIKINRKHLKVKMKGLIGRRLKLRTDKMTCCDFVDVSPSARWSGLFANPSSDFRSIDFGGRRGLFVEMEDGRSYFIGSDDLFERQHEKPFQILGQAS
ncbi:hypothetical protein CLV84_2173 [Neolewinella xylanilytica]|uniref:PH (Pleckstrin Homology) domain-containing protein n=1 Tax=Neolewinella xylanilytica TaxID=1514080 RepID=A0A2S6I2H3_9BACT|nr:hypothetical protein [Neolewinella xylanilytica]PPK85281.1 hypothetical protein CLV84_2173 [Neolewinella xylanilytica]